MKDVKLSICISYWNRGELLRQSLSRMKELYNSRDGIEICIVDDGSREGPESFIPKNFPLDVKIEHLPFHEDFRSPGIAINKAVDIAEGRIIGITQPEIYHLTPVAIEAIEFFETENREGCWISTPTFVMRENKNEVVINSRRVDYVDAELLIGPNRPERKPIYYFGSMLKTDFYGVGKIDESYSRKNFGNEDNEFIDRLEDNLFDFYWSYGHVVHLWHEGPEEVNPFVHTDRFFWGTEKLTKK